MLVAASLLVATLVVPLVLLAMYRSIDQRMGGAFLFAIGEGVLIFIAAVLLVIPVALTARGSTSLRSTLIIYALGLAASSAVAVVSVASGALYSIFLVVPAMTFAALVAEAFIRPMR